MSYWHDWKPCATDTTTVPSLRLTAFAHDIWRRVVRPGDTCVDATCGNGYDSMFLASLIGPTGHLIMLDIQVGQSTSTTYDARQCTTS